LFGIYAAILFGCAYNIYRTLRDRSVPRASGWARNLSDRQLWTIKGAIVGLVLAGFIVFIFVK
jgi:hypothetical protein